MHSKKNYDISFKWIVQVKMLNTKQLVILELKEWVVVELKLQYQEITFSSVRILGYIFFFNSSNFLP